MTSIIVEDQLPALQDLQGKLTRFCPKIEVLGTAGNCHDAKNLINKTTPDLLFLDIDLPDGKGFDILGHFPEFRGAVIFITGHEEYAMRALRFSALDFLLKPVDADELMEAAAKAEEMRSMRIEAEQFRILKEMIIDPKSAQPRLTLRSAGEMYFPFLQDVIYIQAAGEKCLVFVENQANAIEIYRKIGDFEQMFESYRSMMLVHKSYIVNMNKVVKVNMADRTIHLSNRGYIPLSEAHKERFLLNFDSLVR